MNIILPERQPAKYAEHLAAQHPRELGFLPRSVYPRALELGQLRVATHNDDPCGFLLHGPFNKTLRIYQTCIEADLRRIQHGSEILETLLNEAIQKNVHQVSLWCADDLPANWFWKAAGFTHVANRTKSTREPRPQRRWLLELPAGRLHRAGLSKSQQWQTEKKLLAYFAKFHGNADPIARRIQKREE